MITVTDVQSEITKLIKNVAPSVVNIIIKKDIDLYRRDPWGFFQEKVGSVQQKVGGGSGFFVTKDGLILTNKHVVSDADAKYTIITNSWKEYDAHVVAFDPLTDLAVIKVDNAPNEEFPVTPIVESDTAVNIGQFAVAIGNALGEFQNSVSFGVVSGKNRSIQASIDANNQEILTWLLQTDAAINPWNSGGPLIDLDGKIIGINTAIAGYWQGLGFSIPLSQKRISYILESINKYQAIKRPFIGIAYVPVTESYAQELGLNIDYGAYIPNQEWAVVPGSKAELAGLKSGDIILSIDGNKVTIENPLESLIQNKIPWENVNLEVQTASWEKKELSVELGEY